MKEFADDNLRFDKNGAKFSIMVENTVGKGEIARYSVFKRFVWQTRKNQGLFGKWLNDFSKGHLKAALCRKDLREGQIKSKLSGYIGFSLMAFLKQTKTIINGRLLFSFNPFPNKPWFSRVFSTSHSKTLGGKGEIARNEQFLPFPPVFSSRFENFLPFPLNRKLSSTNSVSLQESEICRLGKG